MCNSGMTRSPTLAILYLCLYCEIECWQSPIDVYQILKYHKPMSFPNMKAVINVLLSNRELQYK